MWTLGLCCYAHVSQYIIQNKNCTSLKTEKKEKNLHLKSLKSQKCSHANLHLTNSTEKKTCCLANIYACINIDFMTQNNKFVV